jgi:maltose O-acetyltransferase
MVNFLAHIYFEAKRLFYQWRYPNLELASGVKIKGSLEIHGSVKVYIASDSRLGKRVIIYGSGELVVGSNVLVNGACIGCDRSITIGDDCLISDCFLADSDYHNLEPHLRHSPPGAKVSAPIVIERNVWIGARATVMKGVHIGADSVVGLGSVIRKSVPRGVVVIGNPQQIVKHFQPEKSEQGVGV